VSCVTDICKKLGHFYFLFSWKTIKSWRFVVGTLHLVQRSYPVLLIDGGFECQLDFGIPLKLYFIFLSYLVLDLAIAEKQILIGRVILIIALEIFQLIDIVC
jgi:hypothetical protein